MRPRSTRMMKVRVATLVISLLPLAPSWSSAAAYCSEPSEPSCLASYFELTDELEFDLCRSSVQNFVTETEEYSRCLLEERNAAVERANDAVRKFNCKARREGIC